jgi:putative DNA primase/helicase
VYVADLTNIFNGPWITPPPRTDPPEEQLIEAIADAGLEPPEQVFLDGRIHRFRSGQKKDKTGWYVVFGDGIPAGRFGDWREDISQPWTADIGRQLTFDEVEARKRHIEEAKRIRDQEIEKLHDAVALAAKRIWDGGTPATAEHPYLKRKGVQPHGIKVSGEGKLMIPACTMDGDIKTIQYIDADGKKQFHQGGEAGGNVYFLGDESESPIYIAEGFATAATIHEVTGKPVVVAFSCHNLVEATGKVRDKRGALSEIVVVADNDESGMGEKMARRACQKHGARFVMAPDVGDDVNDFHQKGGDVKSLLAPPLEGWLISVRDFANVPAPIPWLIKGWLPSGCLCMIHGPSGCGKTFLVLHWCMMIASNDDMISWDGRPVRHGKVVYLAGEGHHGLRARVAAWLKHYEVKPDDVDLFVSASGCDLNTPEGWMKVKNHIDALDGKPSVIVVDTLHRFLNGDENSAQDAKIMVDACAGLQMEYGSTIILVHHTGVSDDAQHRARGSSAWKGALDMEASVVMRPNKEDIQIICRKMKDAEEPEPLWLRLQKGIDLPGWYDADGEQVTSAVIVKGEEPCEESQKGPKLNEVQQIGLKAFRIAAETYGQLKDGCFNGVATEAWRREFYRLMPVNSEEDEKKEQERRKKAFQRVQEKLVCVEYVRPSKDGTGYFPAGPLAGVDEQIFTSRLRGFSGIRESCKDED